MPSAPRAAPGLVPLLGVALASCSGTDTGDDYFPLAPGIHWHYRVERTTMDGTRELRHAVVTEAPRAGYAGLRETLGGRRFHYVLSDGAVSRAAVTAPGQAAPAALAQPQIVLPLLPRAGAEWERVTVTAALENTGPPWETLFRITVPVRMRYRIAATDDVVRTPAGRFDRCLRIEAGGSTNTDAGNYIGRTVVAIASTEWYAPGVGLVRMERTETTGAEALDFGRIEMALDRWWRR